MKRILLKFVVMASLLVCPMLSAKTAGPAHANQPPASATPGDPQSTFSLETEREPVVSLQGQWRFQPGDDPRWADPRLDDSHWALVGSGADWDGIGYHHLDGVAWYRFRVTLPAGSDTYALRLPAIRTGYQVFADGHLLLTEGRLPPHPGAFHTRPVIVELPSGARNTDQTMLIALRIWHDPATSHYRHGGLQGQAEVGRSDLIHTQFDTQEQARQWQYSDDFDLGALELLAFGVALVLFLNRQTEREMLWFALLTLGLAGTHFLAAWGRLHAHDVMGLEFTTAFAQTMFLVGSVLFLHSLFRGKQTNWFVFALTCSGLYALTTPFSWAGAITVAQENLLALLFLLPVYVWIVLFVRHEAKRKDPDARILRFPVGFLFFAFAYTRLLWALQTAGMTYFSTFELHWNTPFYLTLDDIAELTFLLAMLTILLRRFTRRSREQDRVESELEAARSVQQVLVPETLPRIAGLTINTAYHPAQEVGGDFFQILPLPSGATLIVIGDVAGKGLPAALQVSLAVGALRTLAEGTESTAAILAGLNRALQGRGSGFTTCLSLSISPDCAVLTFANAGHIAPFVNGFELRTEPNLPLGLVPEVMFEEVRFALNPGDHLTVLTDGVPEAMNHRELFGFERTGQVSRQSAAQIADTARTFGQTDDITVLTIDIAAAGAVAVAVPSLQPSLQPV